MDQCNKQLLPQYQTSKAPQRPSDESCPPLALEPPSALLTPYDNFWYTLRTTSPNKKGQV